MRRTDGTHPKSNYELFNCSNLNIRYWSWNYRGCWPIRCRTVSILSASCTGRSRAFPLGRLCPPEPSVVGTYCSGHPLSSGGFSTSLKPPLSRLGTKESSRRLCVRYDGSAMVAQCELATGLAQGSWVRAFPVPGRLAGSHPTHESAAQLAGVAALPEPPHYLWRQQRKDVSVLPVHQTCPPIDPR